MPPHSLPLWIAAVSRRVSIAKSWHVSPAATRQDSRHSPFGHWLLARCLAAAGQAANNLSTPSTGCAWALAQPMPSWSNTLCCPCCAGAILAARAWKALFCAVLHRAAPPLHHGTPSLKRPVHGQLRAAAPYICPRERAPPDSPPSFGILNPCRHCLLPLHSNLFHCQIPIWIIVIWNEVVFWIVG